MGPKITGIIIDQTQSTGKWYVKEVRSKSGDEVTSVFFRRDKKDLIGRVFDKIAGATSAQRYAAAHMEELDFSIKVDLKNGYNIEDVLKETGDSRKKLSLDSLQKLIEEKCLSADCAPLSGQIQQTDHASLSITVVSKKNDREIRCALDLLLSNYAPSLDGWPVPKSEKEAFKHQMQTSLELQEGAKKFSDPAVSADCKKFIANLANQGDEVWKSDEARAKFGELKEFFLGTVSSTASSPTERLVQPFLSEGTDLSEEQLLKAILPGEQQEKEKLEAHINQAFRILNAMLFMSSDETIRVEGHIDELPSVLATLKQCHSRASNNNVKQSLQALGAAVARYREEIKNKTPGP